MRILFKVGFTLIAVTFYASNVSAQTLLSFVAARNTNSASVSWRVKNESDSTIFAIEKSVDRGKTFQSIGIVQSNRSGVYSFADNTPVTGQNQYRLKFGNGHDNSNYSNALILLFQSMTTANNKVKLYPNPINHSINQDLAGDEDILDVSPVSKQ